MDGETEDLNKFTQWDIGPQVQCISLHLQRLNNLINYTMNNIYAGIIYTYT